MMTFAGCAEDVHIDIPEDFEKAEITGVAVYDANVKFVASKSNINSELQEVTVTLNTMQDIAQLKLTITITTGATVINPLGTQIQDFTQLKTIKIVSPGKSVEKEWTIRVVNP